MSVNINQGTQTSINTTTVGTVETQVVRIDVGSGTASQQWRGLVTENGGTLNRTGTVLNVNFGTFDTFYRHPDRFATVVSTGTNTLGTIKPAVSGSAIYVTDIIISAGTATNVEIASGGTSTPIMGTLHFSDNGGAVMNFVTPLSTASGSALVYKQSVAGPLTITTQGYVD